MNVDVFVPPQFTSGRGIVCIDDAVFDGELSGAVPFVVFNPHTVPFLPAFDRAGAVSVG